MKDEQAALAFKAIEYYKLTLFAPTKNGVVEDARWYACNHDRTRYGFGATALEAVAEAIKYEPPKAQEE